MKHSCNPTSAQLDRDLMFGGKDPLVVQSISTLSTPIRIQNQCTHRRIVPLMLLCVVTVAINFPRPVRQAQSLLRLSGTLFVESPCICSCALFSCACSLLFRSSNQEPKATLVFSVACAHLCGTRGYLRSPRVSPCYHQVANTKITLWEKLCDCTHPRWQCHPQSDLC
jgi:hypothetical protein